MFRISTVLILCLVVCVIVCSCESKKKTETGPHAQAEDAGETEEAQTHGEMQQLGEGSYYRIAAQPLPHNIERRGGTIVLRPYFIGDFFSDEDIYGTEEIESMEAASKETKEFFDLQAMREKNKYGFHDDFFMGCSIWCGVDVTSKKVRASSTLANQGRISYAADNILDLSRNTIWCEGAKGYGIGEYIEITYGLKGAIYESDYFDYSNMCIVNGYTRTDTLWRNNSRVKTLILYINDVKKFYIENGME